MTWQVPPAASMAARADLEKPCACTVSGLVISPRPSTLTGISRRVARPAALSEATSTVAPESNRASRSARLTGWVCVRNISNGIDIFLFGPRPVLGARTRAGALVAAAGGLAVPGSVPAADALAILARPGRGLEVVEA